MKRLDNFAQQDVPTPLLSAPAIPKFSAWHKFEMKTILIHGWMIQCVGRPLDNNMAYRHTNVGGYIIYVWHSKPSFSFQKENISKNSSNKAI
ncbi:MAG: hypothetical protein VCE74_13630 [Alphaproteobacteria bacterium]